MSIVYTTHEQSGHTLDVLTDPRKGLRIMITRLGAEMVSLAKSDEGQWKGFLYRDGDVSAPASGWPNHATLMGYFTHRIKNERTVYRGREIRGATHSFLRHKVFGAPEFSETGGSLTYRIAPSQIAPFETEKQSGRGFLADSILPEEYPGNVAFAITYSLEDGTLKVVFQFENLDPLQSAHVSFALHPGFAVDSLDSAQVLLPSGKYLRHLAPGNFLSGETVAFEHVAGPMPFPKSELPGAFLLEQKDVPVSIYELHTANRRVSLGFEEAPFVTLWSDGNPFICIEPCWGLPDHHEQRPFELKAGMQEIPAGGKLSKGFTIKPLIVA